MYHLKQGPASQSYGIQVARLAGLPDQVLSVAKDKLLALEQSSNTPNHQHSLNFVPATPSIEPTTSALEQKLKTINPDELTARQALDLLYELKSDTK